MVYAAVVNKMREGEKKSKRALKLIFSIFSIAKTNAMKAKFVLFGKYVLTCNQNNQLVQSD
jgi:hypothetical protein